MRVLMTADTVGGVWTYALDLCAALSREGAEITLVTMGRAMSRDQAAAADAVSGLRVIPTEYRLEWMQDPWDDVAAAGQLLLKVAADFQPDVVHLNGFCHASLDWDVVRAPVVVVGHSCVETWFRAVRGEAPGSGWQRYREAVQRGIHDADAFVAPTRAMLDAFTRVYGPHPRGVTIHNGRQGDLYQPAPQREARVLAAGRLWDEAKNIAALADAAQWIEWPVCVAGEEEAPDGGRAEVSVECLGRLTPERLAAEMGRAAIYALPARYEPFGLSAVEAALSGCALVLGDLPTLREVWGDDAVFVNPNAPHRLADAVNSLIEDDDRRHALADRARRRALDYTPRRMAGRYRSLYRELMNRSGSMPTGEQEVTACGS